MVATGPTIVGALRWASRGESKTERLLCRALNNEVRVVANLRAHSAVWGLDRLNGGCYSGTAPAKVRSTRKPLSVWGTKPQTRFSKLPLPAKE